MARDAKVYGPFMGEDEDLIRFAELVVAHEREACAKVCEEQELHGGFAVHCVEAIRARGKA